MIASTRESRFSLTTGTSLSNPTKVSRLRCPACRRIIFDDGAILRCPDGCASLLQGIYSSSPMSSKNSSHTLYRYGEMLPGNGRVAGIPLPAITEMPWLAERYGLRRLTVAISGDYPAHDLRFASGSFKDFEAAAVFARLQRRPDDDVLVLASAGNTALAFVAAAHSVGRTCVIILPGAAFAKMRFTEPVPRNVQFVVVPDGAYDDAIKLSQRLAAVGGFVLEGGVRNCARRDGMGVVLYHAYEKMGGMPEMYVQGVGSCAGPLAINEAAGRLQQDDAALQAPVMLLAQNSPFTPLVAARQNRARQFPSEPADIARCLTAKIDAAVLSNNAPPFADAAGIFDLLRNPLSRVTAVSNNAIAEITGEFYMRERILVDPAAACAVGALQTIPSDLRDARILLHITGSRSLDRVSYGPPENAKIVARREVDDANVIERIAQRVRAER